MDLEILKALLDKVHGCTFATLDAITHPKPGIVCDTVGERVLIYRMKHGSGYENKVKKALAEAGKDPEGFKVSPLSWGHRVSDLPLISHKGKYFLQTIQLAPGTKVYRDTITGKLLSEDILAAYGIRETFPANQGLPPSSAVICKTWNISGILKLILMGESVFDHTVATDRSILRVNYDLVKGGQP